MVDQPNWRVAAKCRTTDAEDLFVTGTEQQQAKLFCRTCPVRTECLAHALDEGIEFGVWGGMTERERRALLRRRPDVESWMELLTDARRAHFTRPPATRAEGPAPRAESPAPRVETTTSPSAAAGR